MLNALFAMVSIYPANGPPVLIIAKSDHKRPGPVSDHSSGDELRPARSYSMQCRRESLRIAESLIIRPFSIRSHFISLKR